MPGQYLGQSLVGGLSQLPRHEPAKCWVSAESAAFSRFSVAEASDHMGKETHIFGAMSPIRARKAALFVIQRPYREKTTTVREIPGLSSIP